MIWDSALAVLIALAMCFVVAERAAADDSEAVIDSPMKQQIAAQLKTYENCLNTGDAETTMTLYDSDPIFMAEYSKAFIGREAVRQGYVRVFQTIKLHVKFSIHEIVDMGGDLAYMRTTSTGEQTTLGIGKVLQEANNELFIFRKEDGRWKIHRYLFASSNAPESQ
jgi:uncharacterized protein (TIGR02246 family)